ncbi:MAG: O-acetylhomoserine aminocarboxypropyltransferase/cysteine synthase family protein [Acidobacteriota bacterium]
MRSWHFDTRCLHGGYEPGIGESLAVPVHRSAAFRFQDPDHAARLFSLEEPGHIYGRLSNPTQEVLENRLAALEGGTASVAVASGTAAVFCALANAAAPGGEILASKALYGGTVALLRESLPSFGLSARLVDTSRPEEVEGAFSDRTRALFVETIGNPTLEVADLPALARVARSRRVPLIVDNTFATPCLCRPLEQGANVVVHSLTKWIGGHGTFLGGAVVDGGTFDWQDERFPAFDAPDASYGGLRFGHDLGALQDRAFALRTRAVLLRNLGAPLSPDSCWMALQGLETLPLRMRRHCANALAAASFLGGHSKVEFVRYPGLSGDPSHGTAQRVLSGGFGGVVVFALKSGLPGARRFLESLRLFSHAANVGDAKSLAILPSATTHAQLSEEDRIRAGIREDFVRLSAGLEHADDLVWDLEQALESA